MTATRTSPAQEAPPFQDDPLWTRISAFAFDDPDARLCFSRRLARENGWFPSHARRVVAEYRKFCYIAMRCGHPVTPSDQVDQAWHLHLLYTHGYWEDWCGTVLRHPLHHGPTRGGDEETAKFRDWYHATLASYQLIFGAPPPAAIWPPLASRFDHVEAFRRVNTATHWVIPDPFK